MQVGCDGGYGRARGPHLERHRPMNHLPRSSRRAAAAGLLGLAAMTFAGAPAWAAPAVAARPVVGAEPAAVPAALPATTTPNVQGQACIGDSGVTVVVDFTDLGGAIEIGCAEGDPASGREALTAAGFEPADGSPGLICTIAALPDGCPPFDGVNFWAYFSGEAGSDWAQQMAGADGIDPAPGAIDAWRYNDGSAGPGVTPDYVISTGTQLTPEPTSGSGSDSMATASDSEESAGPSVVGRLLSVAGIVVIAAIVGVVIRRRRQA